MKANAHVSRADRAYRHPAAQLIFWLTCVGGLALDLWSKNWAWKQFYQGERPAHFQVVIDGYLKLTAVTNKGALFGVGQGWVFFFIVASLAAIGVVLYLFAHSHKNQWGLHLAAGLIMAGAIGNLYDRARLGYVRDFIHFYKELNVGGWEFPLWIYIFNVADVMLVIGVGILLIYWYILPFFHPPRKEQDSTRAPLMAPQTTPAYPTYIPTPSAPEPADFPPASENPPPQSSDRI